MKYLNFLFSETVSPVKNKTGREKDIIYLR